MKKVRLKEAKERYNKGETVYLLSKDGAKSQAQGTYSLIAHDQKGLEFGIKE